MLYVRFLGSKFHPCQVLTPFHSPRPGAVKYLDEIKELSHVVVPTATNREEFLAEARSGAFEGCVAVLRTFDSVKITGLIDRELVEALPKSLRFLSHLG